MKSERGVNDTFWLKSMLKFVQFIHSVIKQLQCTLEPVSEDKYQVKKSGKELGVILVLSQEPGAFSLGTLTVHVDVDYRCILPFDDARFYKHAENESDMPTVVASPNDPKEIAIFLEFLSKAVYFADANLRVWECADCDTNGIEVFLQNGTITTVDKNYNTFYLVVSEDERQQGDVYDDLADQYVLALCHECFTTRGFNEA